MPEDIIITLPVKRYGADMDCIGWDFMDVDVSVLVNGFPLDREEF
jgi:hypothetical protein